MSKEAKNKSKDLQLYKTKKLLESLKTKRGFHTELISLYIPPERKLSDVTNYLKNEVSESQNIKSKLTRNNVLTGISTLLGQLKNFTRVPENGMVLFSGAIPQNNTPGTERQEIYIIDEPPDKVKNYRYYCAAEFLTEPLEEMIAPKETYGLIVIERAEAAVGYVRGSRVEVVKEFTSGIMGKHRAGGQSSVRFERGIEEAEIRFYRRIADTINEVFLPIEDLKGIFVGGPGFSKDKFVKDEGLDYRLREKILSTEDIGYGGYEGIRALLDKVKDKIKDVKYIHERDIMQNFMKLISNDSGLAVYGIKEVEKVLNFGAVDTIIFSEKLDLFKAKIECVNCGYIDYRIVKEQDLSKLEQEMAAAECPKCKSITYKVTGKRPLIEDFGEIAESTGTTIEIISSGTEEGEGLMSTFGGIVAILRFKMGY